MEQALLRPRITDEQDLALAGGGVLVAPVPRTIFTRDKVTDEQKAFADAADTFFRQAIWTKIPEIEEKAEVDGPDGKKVPLVIDLVRQAADVGLCSIEIPERFGGLGLDLTTAMHVAEMLRGCASFAATLGAHNGIGTLPIAYFGSEAQKQEWLPRLAKAEKIACYALTEPGNGSDALGGKTNAALSADKTHFVLNGQKQFITNGAWADVAVVFAQVGGKYSGLIVDLHTPGVVRGAEEKKMGIKGSSTTQLIFQDVKVPVGNLLGEPGDAARIALNILYVGRMKLGFATMGTTKYVIDLTVSYMKSRKQFGRAALDEATDAIVVVDRIGREIVRNAPARRFDGARHGEVLAQDAVDELLRHALDGATSQRELDLYGPPRQVLHVRSFPLRRDGEVVGAVAFTRDISEARRVESVRRDFVANVSHELKTPIGAALGLLAETMAVADDPKVVQQLADRVVREADRLSRIVDDLLDLSQIEAQESPSRAPIPVPLLIAETIDLIQAAADLADVPILVSPSPPDIELVCDRRQMRSALMNLLDNAIKYSGPRQPVEIGAVAVGDRVSLVVRDHGIGIPTRDLERIFERFYRVDRARSRDTGGTGLGLAIVRHVAQAHGGDVTVESREGEGSMFTLKVPIANGHTLPVSEVS